MARDPTPDLSDLTEPELIQVTQDILDRIENDRKPRPSKGRSNRRWKRRRASDAAPRTFPNPMG